MDMAPTAKYLSMNEKINFFKSDSLAIWLGHGWDIIGSKYIFFLFDKEVF
jgi:hypothetical protein